MATDSGDRRIAFERLVPTSNDGGLSDSGVAEEDDFVFITGLIRLSSKQQSQSQSASSHFLSLGSGRGSIVYFRRSGRRCRVVQHRPIGYPHG
jgi:hypothetical protein